MFAGNKPLQYKYYDNPDDSRLLEWHLPDRLPGMISLDRTLFNTLRDLC